MSAIANTAAPAATVEQGACYVDEIKHDAETLAAELHAKALAAVLELHALLSKIEAAGAKDLGEAKAAVLKVGEDLHALIESGSEQAANLA